MEQKYDVVVAGGGIAGSVAARFLADYGFKTLLLERFKTPRSKSCSGVQWRYLERLIGTKIPRNKLCRNEINKVELVTPKGKILKGNMRLLNFWRDKFDSWLNEVAVSSGADFNDQTTLLDFHENSNGVLLHLSFEGFERDVSAQYLIAADGLSSTIRRKMRPHDFGKRSSGATLNYYFIGEAELNSNTLYMFYKREFSPLMFSWVYNKDDQWVIGTGADKNILGYANRFFEFIREKYGLDGKIVRKEGFSSTFYGPPYLGNGRILMAGDAAGLVDFYRGMGMDNAALSGRLAAKAISQSKGNSLTAIAIYRRLMKRIISTLEKNSGKQAARYVSDEKIEESLSTMRLFNLSVRVYTGNLINMILPVENIVLLP